MTDNDYSRLIFKYLAHEINAEEKEALLSWLEQSQENRELFASVSAMMSASGRKMDKAEYESFMARLDARIDADEAEEGKGVRTNAEDIDLDEKDLTFLGGSCCRGICLHQHCQ